MWAALKKALTTAIESLGIEIPGLPVDLGSLGDTVATVTQGVTDAAAGSLDGLTVVGDQVTGALAGVSENVTNTPATIASAAQAVPTLVDVVRP